MKRMFVHALALIMLWAPATVIATPHSALADAPRRTAQSQKLVDAVIKRGLSQRGVPYAYGGGDVNGPTKTTQDAGRQPADSFTAALFEPAPTRELTGFDASGLMVYSFAAAGIKLPRRSNDQYNAGRKVLPAEALPGDLIFYGPDGNQSVTLYLGNNMMLEATPPAVQVSPVRFGDITPYLVRVIE